MEDSILPDKVKNIKSVFILEFDEKLSYIQTSQVEFNAAKQYIYLLRKGAANGTNYGPCSQITQIEKTLKNKIIAWFEAAGKIQERYSEESKKIAEELNIHSAEIVENISKELVKKENYLLTTSIQGKMPYEIPWIFEIYQTMVKTKIFGDNSNIGTCYLCKRKNVPMVPEYKVYKFFTKDKPGFISGGFCEENFWRNCPVCVDCQPILNKARQYIEDNLKYRYYGLTYYIIPSTLKGGEGLNEILDILSQNSPKTLGLGEHEKQEFEADNEDILYTLREVQDINSFRIVFLEKSNSAERILLDVKDVYPSRFQVMYQAKTQLDKMYGEAIQIGNNNETIKIPFNFSFFREFLSKSDERNRDYDLNELFLSLTQSVFRQNRIDFNVFLPHYMRKIRRLLDSEDERYKLKTTVLKAIMGKQYLILVHCLSVGKEKTMETSMEEFFENYQMGLDTNVKKALVLIGALIQKVMNIQYREISSSPFTKQLKSLRLREEEIKGIVAQAINKMQEYECYSKKSQEILKYV